MNTSTTPVPAAITHHKVATDCATSLAGCSVDNGPRTQPESVRDPARTAIPLARLPLIPPEHFLNTLCRSTPVLPVPPAPLTPPPASAGHAGCFERRNNSIAPP
jgi:hypothetical protein